VLSLSYDAQHRLTAVHRAGGHAYALAYDATGRLTSITDGNLAPSRAYGFAYDGDDRLISITDPQGNAEAFAYDADNLLTSITDRRGIAATIAYATPAGSPHTRLPATVAKEASARPLPSTRRHAPPRSSTPTGTRGSTPTTAATGWRRSPIPPPPRSLSRGTPATT